MNRNRFIPLVVILVVLVGVTSTQNWSSAAVPAQQTSIPSSPAPQERADTAASSVPVPGGPSFYMVSTFAFRPLSPDVVWAYANAKLYNPSATDADYQAALSLPNGVRINKVVVYFFDHCGSDLSVRLWRDGTVNDATDLMAMKNSSGIEDFDRHIEQTYINYPITDQQNYSYRISVIIPGGCSTYLSLYSIRIDYGYSVNLPITLR